ncbi:barstar family protein (plasmid) [Bartonella sp. HY329]|uniref:barstar family protein n=1 Tax=unclassified Bartonella TaxID=2645622 RepID=UPI0021CA49F3|nr:MULTISPECIES: barstar family protein [unclassified Bartonella]UXM96539.1 barstar family protein [Bartonella sp. HY329]UXN10862.1 barstar family protein [Bartonella sp. HY328]
MDIEDCQFKYVLELDEIDHPSIKAEFISNIFSIFHNEKVFIVLNPEIPIEQFYNQRMGLYFYINDLYICEYINIKTIEKCNTSYILTYNHVEKDPLKSDLFDFATNLYFNFHNSERVWQNFNTVDKVKYLSAVPWRSTDYPKTIVIDGNIIDGCLDFYCEIGFLLNHNQWAYFGWNLDALSDCLDSLPRDTKIIWKNYERSRILIDQDCQNSMRLGFSPMFYANADDIFYLLKEHVDVERII